MKAIVNLSREETLKARYNQPRVSLEELRGQMERHRQASEEFFKDAKNEISKRGPRQMVADGIAEAEADVREGRECPIDEVQREFKAKWTNRRSKSS